MWLFLLDRTQKSVRALNLMRKCRTSADTNWINGLFGWSASLTTGDDGRRMQTWEIEALWPFDFVAKWDGESPGTKFHTKSVSGFANSVLSIPICSNLTILVAFGNSNKTVLFKNSELSFSKSFLNSVLIGYRSILTILIGQNRTSILSLATKIFCSEEEGSKADWWFSALLCFTSQLFLYFFNRCGGTMFLDALFSALTLTTEKPGTAAESTLNACERRLKDIFVGPIKG